VALPNLDLAGDETGEMDCEGWGIDATNRRVCQSGNSLERDRCWSVERA
jgi:hypothetical protein